MAMAPITSGSSITQPSKGVSMNFNPKEKQETIIEQENKDANLQAGVTNQNTVKGVKEVDEMV